MLPAGKGSAKVLSAECDEKHAEKSAEGWRTAEFGACPSGIGLPTPVIRWLLPTRRSR